MSNREWLALVGVEDVELGQGLDGRDTENCLK